jgi:hypothetical protein
MNCGTPIDPASLDLPRRVHACVAGDWLIFLDLTGNRYFAVPATAPHESIRKQMERQLQQAEPRKGRRARPLSFTVPPFAPDAIIVAEAGLWAHRVVSRGRLDAAFDWIETQKAKMAGARAGSRTVASAHEDFERLRAWLPSRYVCLFNALCLTRFLLRRGLDAHLVFGVRGMPFAAHCWVEAEGVILDPGEEDCSAFTQIVRV